MGIFGKDTVAEKATNMKRGVTLTAEAFKKLMVIREKEFSQIPNIAMSQIAEYCVNCRFKELTGSDDINE